MGKDKFNRSMLPNGDNEKSTNPKNPKPLWTVEDVARYLQLEPETVRGLARKNKLPALKVGRVWRFQPDHIEEWVNNDTNSYTII